MTEERDIEDALMHPRSNMIRLQTRTSSMPRLDDARRLAAKRKPAVSDDLASGDVSVMTADMAEKLRAQLLAKTARLTKKRRLRTRPVIDISCTQYKHSRASLLGLPRELRDVVYQYLWADKPWIRQKYLRKTYTVTYGECYDLVGGVYQSGTVCCSPTCHERLPRVSLTTFQAMWLLASKQMMIEGLEEFHRRSVWIFEYSSKNAKSQYIFPLITPTRVHEQHLYMDGSSGKWHSPRGLQVHYVPPRLSGWPSERPRIVRTSSVEVGLANVMTTATDAEDAVQTIKMYVIAYGARVFKMDRGPGGRYAQGTQIFDFSKLDRLAVHRKLRAFEVHIRTPINLRYHDVEALKTTVKNVITELKNVGDALIPGGTAAEVDIDAGWPIESGVNCCQFRVDKV